MPNDVSTALPAVDLQPSSTLTVTVDQAGTTLGFLNVHGFQVDPDTGDGGGSPPVEPGTAFSFGDTVE